MLVVGRRNGALASGRACGRSVRGTVLCGAASAAARRGSAVRRRSDRPVPVPMGRAISVTARSAAGRGEPGVDGVLVSFEDADLDDLVVSDPVDVGSPDVEGVLAGAEALMHEQCYVILSDQGVDESRPSRPPGRARSPRGDRRRRQAVREAFRRGPTDPAHSRRCRRRNGRWPLPVACPNGGEIAAHDIDRLHGPTLSRARPQVI